LSSRATELAAKALAEVKAGAVERAIALIESSGAALRGDEAVIRVHAIAVAQLGDPKRALELLSPALKRAQVNPQSQVLAARLFEDINAWSDAFEHYVAIVRMLPSQLAFWRGLWRCALALDTAAAVARALALVSELKPDFSNDVALLLAVFRARRKICANDADVGACLALGEDLLHRFPEHDEAQSAVTRFVVDALPTRAAAWLSNARIGTARATNANTLNIALAMPQLFADEAAIDLWRAKYDAGLRQFSEYCHREKKPLPSLIRTTAFSLAYQARSNVSLQRLRGDALAHCVTTYTPPRSTFKHNDAPPRVGFVSKHIRDCTVGQYFRRFMSDLNNDSIAVYTYACGETDAFTDAVEQKVTQPRRFPLSGDDDNDDAVLERIAQVIADDSLDVLIYPEIGMEPLIEKLAAMRLAPLQCALWGHPDTTGLPTIDVFFSAESMESRDADSHYCEQLVRLPGLGCAYPRPPLAASLDRAQLDLPRDAPLLVCAQASFKWRAHFVDATASILKQNQNATLVYFRSRDNVATLAFDEYLREKLDAQGVDANARTIALAETTRERFLAVLRACDLSLDTFDFSGGNTTLDALSVGLPVLTLPGEFMRGRQSMAMLNIIDAPQLIARDTDDYVHIANELLRDHAALAQLRATILSRAEQLFDDERAISALAKWIVTRVHETRTRQP
jgi:predicted O-linked N-acetylglucosamine transferase (SPINDLY family)